MRKSVLFIGAMLVLSGLVLLLLVNLDQPVEEERIDPAPIAAARNQPSPPPPPPSEVPATPVDARQAALSGTVMMADTHAPVSGIKVIAGLNAETAPPAVDTVSDDQGRYAFADLPAGNYYLKIESGNYVIVEGNTPEFVLSPGLSQQIDLYLTVPAVIQGRIYDAETGEGIAEAHVSAKGMGFGRARTVSTDDGTYRISAVTPGMNQLIVTLLDRQKLEDASLTVAAGETLTHDVAVRPGVTGVVLNPDGSFAADATVTYGAQGLRTATVQANGLGRFRILGWHNTQDFTLLASLDGETSVEEGPFHVPWDGLRDVTLVLRASAEAAGIVVDDLDIPIAGAEVFSGDGSNRVVTAEDGTFTLTKVEPGRINIAAVAEGLKESVELTLQPGERAWDIRIVIATSGDHEIAGRVVDEAGNPLQAQVAAFPGENMPGKTTETALDGVFHIDGLTEAEYIIVARAGQEHDEAIIGGVAAGSMDLVITLAASKMLTGRVVDAANNTPVTRFEAELSYDSSPDLAVRNSRHFQRFTDPDGRFALRVDDEKHGQGVLLVRAAGYSMAAVPSSIHQQGEVLVRLQKAGVVKGAVRDASGKAVSGAQVFTGRRVPSVFDSSRIAFQTETDATGAFTLEGLPDGTVRLTAYHAVAGKATVEVRVIRGNGGPVNFVLAPAAQDGE